MVLALTMENYAQSHVPAYDLRLHSSYTSHMERDDGGMAGIAELRAGRRGVTLAWRRQAWRRLVAGQARTVTDASSRAMGWPWGGRGGTSRPPAVGVDESRAGGPGRAKFDGAKRRSSIRLLANYESPVYYTSEPLRAEGGALSGPWVFHRQGRAKHAPPEPRDEASPRRSNQAALHGAD